MTNPTEAAIAQAKPKGHGLMCVIFATDLYAALAKDGYAMPTNGSFGPATSEFIRAHISDYMKVTEIAITPTEELGRRAREMGAEKGGEAEYGPGSNTGHGHVWKRPDGVTARCGGPALCLSCRADAKHYPATPPAQAAESVQVSYNSAPTLSNAQAAEAVEYRMWDSQWVNVVNHERAYSGWDMEEAINHAVKLTEKAMARNVADGNWPPSRAAIAAMQAGENNK